MTIIDTGRRIRRGIFAAMLSTVTAGTAHAATYYVDSAGAGAYCTLANPCPLIATALGLAAAGDTISVAAGTYAEAGMSITTDVTIVGAGSFATIIDASGLNQRIFDIAASNVVLDKLALQNASVSGQNGAAIRLTSGNLTVARSRIIGNNAAPGGAGGAIAAETYAGTVNILTTTIDDNNAGFDGGGIWCYGCGGVNVLLSRVVNNSAGGQGGGVWVYLSTLVTRLSSVSHNSADMGGGIMSSYATTRVLDSEVSDNTADELDGGGIYATGVLDIERSTLARNDAPVDSGGAVYFAGAGILASSNSTYSGNTALCGGGLFMDAAFAVGPDVKIGTSTFVDNTSAFAGCANHLIEGANTIELHNSIVSGGAVGNPACSRAVTDGSNNLLVDASCDPAVAGFNLGVVTGLNPALAYNGGLTRTHMIDAASNAIDAGNNAACVNPWFSWYGPPLVPLTIDQRGAPRPRTLVDPCDVGAVERQ